MELDDVFAKKDDIANAVKENIAAIMKNYGYDIVKTLITDIDPDHNVKESMNRINAAKRDKEAAVEEAEAKKIKIVKEAEAEAESKRLSGEGIAQQRLEIVRGFKESVEDFQKSLKDVTHEEVMQFVLLTQYFDTLNNVGSNSKNTSILIPHSPSSMKDFQGQIIQGTYVGQKLRDNTTRAPEAEEK
jgi:regulator of protease activity HflC (stomatin/prohibitin superfamily)